MTIGIFISELLTKVLRDAEDENKELYRFLENSLLFFDRMTANVGHFHLQFMLKLSAFLGFQPYDIEELLEQIELDTERGVKFAFSFGHKKILNQLYSAPYEADIEVPTIVKNAVLERVIRYYQLHEEHLGKLKSLIVLREVFHS